MENDLQIFVEKLNKISRDIWFVCTTAISNYNTKREIMNFFLMLYIIN